jgi:hypothetical protein
MTLYDLIMGLRYGKAEWAALGRGEVKDEETVKKMLMQGYEALADED